MVSSEQGVAKRYKWLVIGESLRKSLEVVYKAPCNEFTPPRVTSPYCYIHTCMHTYIHAYIHAYIHTYTYQYIHTYRHRVKAKVFFADKNQTILIKLNLQIL